MPAAQVFNVLTEFKFEIGDAVLSSNILQSKMETLSGAANDALISFKNLGLGVAANLGLVGGGFLGAFGQALNAAEDFRKSQIALSSILFANKELFTGPVDTFNGRLQAVQITMGNIVKTAREFALPEKQLFDLTKILAGQLAGKGLTGTNLEVPVDLARGLLKAAPLLQLDIGDIGGQLARLIEGGASGGDTLFRRLGADTQAFKPFAGGGGAQKFNVLPAAQRVEILSKGLNQFSSDTEALNDRVNSLSGQMQILKDSFLGFGSVLIPIGEVLRNTIVPILKEVNRIIRDEGAAILKNFSILFKAVADDPKNLIVNLMQLKQLQSDAKKAGSLLGISAIFVSLGHVLHFIGVEGKLVTFLLAPIGGAFRLLGSGLRLLMGFLPRLLPFLLPLARAFIGVLAPAFAFLALMQLISRAQAIATVNDASALPAFMKRFTDILVDMQKSVAIIISPLTQLFETLAQLIAPLFQITVSGNILLSFLEIFASFLDRLATVVVGTMAIISASFEAMFTGISNLMSIHKNLFNPSKIQFESIGDAFTNEFNRFVAGANGGGEKPNAVAQNVVNIGTQNVAINNAFKEQQEPDRIAFTLKDQLQKLSQAPRQGKGSSFGGNFSTAPITTPG